MTACAAASFIPWLVRADNFFQSCPMCGPNARTARDATLNLFDPATGECACSLCAGHDRPLLQVRRSSYHDVVKVSDLARLAPGSTDGVQAYVINSCKVLFLRRRPQPRPPKGAAGAAQCTVCGRHLADVAAFCSLQCKLDGCGGGVCGLPGLPPAPATPTGEGAAAAGGGGGSGGGGGGEGGGGSASRGASPASSASAAAAGAGHHQPLSVRVTISGAKRGRSAGGGGGGLRVAVTAAAAAGGGGGSRTPSAAGQPGTPARGSEEGGGGATDSGRGGRRPSPDGGGGGGGGGGGCSSPLAGGGGGGCGGRRKRARPARAHFQ